MVKTARERLARLLGGAGPVGSFSAQLSAPAHLVGLQVSGVGPVKLPLRAPLAKKLIAVARPAKFGRGEQTLTDTDVRDTWELTPEQFTLDGPGWPTLLDGALEHFRCELGLPYGSRLRAEPHSMLIYGKGQFFLPHQDSEKHDAMVGTLVVSLPSAHTGGELIIEHAGKSVTYRASKDELTLIAFYADCHHQVTPVTSGYRHTLTFNLLTDAAPASVDTGSAAEHARCLTEHFANPATGRYPDRNPVPPNRLVFLLDHEYTQRGLGWGRLKGADAERAALLRTAADQAGCESVLALAEVKETWDALPDGDSPWDYDSYGYDDEEDEDDRIDAAAEDAEGYQLQDLIDDEVTLSWWTRPAGTGGESVSLRVRDHEVCAATPSADLKPYQSEYEGYMGNYGNTLDRWYRRAAIVVWPREKAFAARAEAGSAWALREIRSLADAGDLVGARNAAQSLAPFWERLETEAGLLATALDAAEAVEEAETAAMLLRPFHAGLLTRQHAVGLAAVTRQYGEGWARTVVTGWFEPQRPFPRDGLDKWTDATLPGLHGSLRTADSPLAARLLATAAWSWLAGELRTWTTMTYGSEVRQTRLKALSAPLARLLEVADTILRKTIAQDVSSYEDTVLECLMPALRLAPAPAAAGLGPLVRDCAQRLRRIATTPPRAEGDWSIPWTGCGCAVCETLGTFLGSRTRRVHEWPLAKDGRRHVHAAIDRRELPVRHQTRRQGRPYTLVLTKTDQLFTDAATARAMAAADLAWLTKTHGPY
jgi:hypothetical protein